MADIYGDDLPCSGCGRDIAEEDIFGTWLVPGPDGELAAIYHDECAPPEVKAGALP